MLRFLAAPITLVTIGATLLAAGAVFAAQDRYTVQVPGGLSFSEFKGYEN
jgi:hypothetical protein